MYPIQINKCHEIRFRIQIDIIDEREVEWTTCSQQCTGYRRDAKKHQRYGHGHKTSDTVLIEQASTSSLKRALIPAPCGIMSQGRIKIHSMGNNECQRSGLMLGNSLSYTHDMVSNIVQKCGRLPVASLGEELA
jgi:hypothetical protein